MSQALGPLDAVVDLPERPVPEPRLLVELEPRSRVFFRNLKDLFFPQRLPPLRLISWPAAPWPDVLVSRRLPWWGWAESLVIHVAVVAAILGAVRIWPPRIQVAESQAFHREDVIYYDPAEYLPPLDTGGSRVPLPQAGQPEYAAQPIISVPPEADNHSQTIVTPPNIKLTHDVPLPNMVAWSKVEPSVPLAATARSVAQMKLPAMAAAVVAPPPEVQRRAAIASPSIQEAAVAPPPELNSAVARRELQGPSAAVIAPPPRVENAASIRHVGDITIGHAQAVAPAPQLPVGEQRAAGRVGPLRGQAPEVVPPPPSLPGGEASGATGGGQIISLSVHPLAPSAGFSAGNRRGTFAATPQGKPGAPATPNIPGDPAGAKPADGKGGKNGNGAGAGADSGTVPPGLYVGAAPAASDGAATGGAGEGAGTQNRADSQPDLLAKAAPPRVTAAPPRRAVPDVAEPKGDLERQVFGSRKYYSMMVSMPNLTSAGGSWIIRFAELNKADVDAQSPAKTDLSAPIATRQVDPKYPLELMRHNVQGTVTLYAIIHSDGTVSDVKVLRGVDDRIDEYAREALAAWQFRPGTKDGNPVDVEAVVVVPFKPMRMKSAF